MAGHLPLYELIKEAFLLLDFGDRRLLEPFGLSTSRYYALYHIAAAPGISPSRLSSLMFCDKSNISRLLHELEGAGLVERRPHEGDGRAQRLFLTPGGRTLQRQVGGAHAAYVAQRLDGLTADESDALGALLARLNLALSDNLGGDTRSGSPYAAAGRAAAAV